VTKTILVPVDLEHQARHHLGAAVRIANSEQAALHLLTVLDAPPVRVSQYLPSRYQQSLSDETRTQLETVFSQMVPGFVPAGVWVRFGSVYREILAAAVELKADLIVMGSHDPGPVDYLLGSNAAHVVRHAHCSVFIVRPSSGAA
jgi:nucleotide-binding universal stress UspA family protein